ncbi:MAG: N(5)-(carboxyethyl)ornithine synthase [Myxococcales bacterium]|nr:N(5)-(carboxyethyl)ornithine synthase [Myxococcales bacterium]
MSKPLTMGVIGQSYKADEQRAPIDPSHIKELPANLLSRIFFQAGYGERFGVRDEVIAAQCGGVLPTDELYAACDIILLPKPTAADFPRWRKGQVIWGWPHCVQGPEITQEAIDKELTLIAWEAMNLWKSENVRDLHIFHKNNEIAGYAAVMHALSLRGTTGHYGRKKRAAVISFGLTARGSVHALQGLGFSDITVYTRRSNTLLHGQIPGLHFEQFELDEAGDAHVIGDNGTRPMAHQLQEMDVIVNCIFQDTDKPAFFARESDLEGFQSGALIIDVSCDRHMGFDFASPTSFANPTFEVGDGLMYYAVDHTPAYLWRAATWEISKALLPFVPTVMAGPDAWEDDIVIRKAIELQSGVIRNPKILSFQHRSPEHPHPFTR